MVTVPVPYHCDHELHLWRTVQELGGPSSYVFTAIERIRGQWPYSLRQFMSSVSANDAPVTRDTSVAISHVHGEKDARRTMDRTRSEWTVDGSDNRTGAYGVDEITWRPYSWSRFDRLTDSVRNQWVHTMHHRSAIHLAMGILTERQHVTSPQHAELGKSRHHHDLNDLHDLTLIIHSNLV